MALSLVNDHRNLLAESPEDAACYLEFLDPLPFRTPFEPSGLLLFILDMERFEKKPRVQDHVIPLPSIGLLVVFEKGGKIPSGDLLLQKGCSQCLCMVRVGARQRRQHPSRRPYGNVSHPHHLQNVVRQCLQKREPS